MASDRSIEVLLRLFNDISCAKYFYFFFSIQLPFKFSHFRYRCDFGLSLIFFVCRQLLVPAFNNNVYFFNVSFLARPLDLLLSTVKRRKLSWFDHVCHHDTLPKIILHGCVDTIKEWTGQSMCCRGQASMSGHHSDGICRGTPTTPGRHGV